MSAISFIFRSYNLVLIFEIVVFLLSVLRNEEQPCSILFTAKCIRIFSAKFKKVLGIIRASNLCMVLREEVM